ncbi:MAG: alanine--tRNA ligase [Bacillota bacterium]
MKRLSGDEVRRTFLDFFASKGHLILPSAPLTPENDPSLLLIGAGMAPFKRYFARPEEAPRGRVSTSQKCIRTPDIERVGKTGRHATCFEMLGNFSFGDYFKRDAIHWAWEYLTDVIDLPKEKLYITVHKNDDEAYKIWHEEIGVPADRLILGDEDNFWEIGTGPCGPCSEIFIDRGSDFGCGKPDCGMGCDCDRFLEIWNLVFTQYDRDEDGNYNPLDRKCIDTGLGLDRIAAVLQDTPSIFEMDLNKPVLDYLIRLSGKHYDGKSRDSVSLRVITDHVRGVTFMVADGIMPGNEGRGYVLRRLLRRAVRYGRLLGIEQPFLADVVKLVINQMKVGYPELEEKADYILKVISTEERRFNETLEAGLELVTQWIERLRERGERVLEGEIAFRLHDTYGFPLDLTKELLEEQGLTVDEAGFTYSMNQQRERARAARQDVDAMGVGRGLRNAGTTKFVGYDGTRSEASVVSIIRQNEEVESAGPGDKVEIILDQTPFYAESGGQVGDTGHLITEAGEHIVHDTTKDHGGAIHHHLTVGKSGIRVGQTVSAVVDEGRRQAIMRHHSATHLLHEALREVLGSHVHQAGSLVGPDRLRFDFSHYASLSIDEISHVERRVNHRILDNLKIDVQEMNIDAAKARGATALFVEKYGDTVRVVAMGDYSMELCGGTHVQATGQIGLFTILSEGGIGSGIRRIEAVAGENVLHLLYQQRQTLEQIGQVLKAKESDLVTRVQALTAQLKEAERERERLQVKAAASEVDELMKNAQDISGIRVLAAHVSAPTMDALRQMADMMRDRLGSGVLVLGAAAEGKVNLVTAVTKDLVGRAHAGNLIREIAKLVDGGGGGKPDMAQAGGKSPDKLPDAITKVAEIVRQQLKP